MEMMMMMKVKCLILSSQMSSRKDHMQTSANAEPGAEDAAFGQESFWSSNDRRSERK